MSLPNSTTLRRRALWAAAAAAAVTAAVAGCRDATSVPDLNNIPQTTVQGTLNPASVQFLATGVLNKNRANYSFLYLVFGETLGQDVYNIDPAEQRFVTQLLGSTISSNNFIGADIWPEFYNNILTINTTLTSLAHDSSGFDAAQTASTRGFFRTVKALELYNVWAEHGQNGIVIQLPALGQPATPIVCQQTALAYISALLDSAYTDLQAGSSAGFAFNLPAGFSSNGDFTSPGGFALFNRGLKGRVEVYRAILGNAGSYQAAINALNQSFISAAAVAASGAAVTATDLTSGVYYTYSTAANEQTNPLAVPTIAISNMAGDSVVAKDMRASKIVTDSANPVSGYGLSTPYTSPLASPANQTGSIPLLRGAELVLLRAQAEIGAGDLASATADINTVRTTEGGLPAYPTFTDPNAAINAVLYEKRYSLLLTGPQRLVDLRAYGRLGPNGPANFPYIANNAGLKGLGVTPGFLNVLPIPQGEADARKGNVQCTGS